MARELAELASKYHFEFISDELGEDELNMVAGGTEAVQVAPMALNPDDRLANIDLQNMLQKQQQTIQMLSNVSKVLHDTSLAVQRKVG